MATYNDVVAWEFAESFFYDVVNPFPSDVGQIGKYLHVTGGVGFTPGYYRIVQVFPSFATGTDGNQNMFQVNGPPFPAAVNTRGGDADIVDTPALIPGVLTAGAITTGRINLSWTAPTFGSPPYVNHLWRGENRFGALLTDLGNVSSVSSYVDSNVETNRTYNYYLTTVDNAAASANSNEVLSYLADDVPVVLGVLGDSNYAVGVSGRTTNAALQMLIFMQSANGLRSVTMNNQSVGGIGIHDFQPGSSNYTNLKNGWSGAGVTNGFIIEGYNDSNYGLTKEEYMADVLAVCNALFDDVPTLVNITLGYCFGKGQDGTTSPDSSNQFILTYHEGQDEIVAADTMHKIRAGSKSLFRFIGANPSLLTIDSNIHLNDAGCAVVGRINAEGMTQALYGTGGGGGGDTDVVLIGNRFYEFDATLKTFVYVPAGVCEESP